MGTAGPWRGGVRRRATLTFRLVAGVVLAQLALAAGLVFAGVWLARRELRGAFDTRLQGELMSVAALVRYQGGGPALVFDAALRPPNPNPRQPDFYEVREPGGAVLASTFPAPVVLPPPQPGQGRRFWNFRYDGHVYRGWMLSRLPILDTEPDLTGPPALLDVYYAASTRPVREEVTAIGIAIAAVSLALLLLTSLLAAIVVRRELRPLRALARDAAAISPWNWEFRPDPEAPAELAPLIAALRQMLERLHASHRQQREFLADAAHHLKTPVAIVKSTWQSLLRRPRAEAEYRAAAEATLTDLERLERLLQRMLRLARSEQDRGPGEASAAGARADVAATCQAALDRVRPLAEARGVRLASSGCADPVWARAGAEDLEQVWVNLLENAVQHSPPDGFVEIACRAAAADPDGRVEVWVCDQGPGIPSDEVARIFDRFHRGRNPCREGFGLGLAIARALVERYGGRLELAAKGEVSAAPGFSGAVFRATLPSV